MSLSKEQAQTAGNPETVKPPTVITERGGSDGFREGMLARAWKMRVFRDIDPDMGRDATVDGEPLDGRIKR